MRIEEKYFKGPEEFQAWFVTLPQDDKSRVLQCLKARLEEIKENELVLIDELETRMANEDELADTIVDAIDFYDEERAIIAALIELAEKAVN